MNVAALPDLGQARIAVIGLGYVGLPLAVAFGRRFPTMGFDINTPWRKLPAKARKAILEGCDEQVHVRYKNRYGRTRSYYADYEGVMAYLQRRMQQTDSEHAKERYEGFMRDVPYWQAALCAALTFGIEAVCEPYLPGGVRGLALAGLLALPGSVVFVLITLGVRGSKEAYAMVRRG